MIQKNNPWVKICVAMGLLAGVFFFLRFLNVDFSNVDQGKFRDWVDSLGVWGPVIYIVFYLFRPLILFPAGVLSAAAGVIWGPLLGFLYLQIAANISSAAEFFFVRYFGRDLVEKHLKGRVQQLDAKIGKHGFLTVLLVRLIPNVAWDVQNLSLGLTKVKSRDYFLATFLGIMPGSFAFVFFGASLIKVIVDPKNIWILLLAIIFFAGIIFLQKYLKKNQKEKMPGEKIAEGK